MTTITVIRGDGIGPEIMDATLGVLDAMNDWADAVPAPVFEAGLAAEGH